MPKIVDEFKKEISELVATELKNLSSDISIDIASIAGYLLTPPDFTLGQAALPCFPFAKVLKLPPVQIANKLAEQINNASKLYIAQATAINGYLNFHANFSNCLSAIVKKIQHKEFYACNMLTQDEQEKIIIEYSQPNTHKALHVGHLRGLVLGDSVSKILEYVGHKIVRATYPGDMGTHVAKTLWYIKNKYSGKLPTSDQANWLGKIYAEADEAYKACEGTEQEAIVKAEITNIFHDLHGQTGVYFELWKLTREWSFAEMRSIYDWFGVKFDFWYTESECEKPSRDLVLQKYQEGFFVKHEGAVGLDLSTEKLGFALFLKSDGNGLYLTKDLELLRQKFLDSAITRSIYVVDSRQKLHFQQLFKTAEKMGYPQATKSVHLSYETVNTMDGKAFSSRALNGLKLRDLKFKMEEKVSTDYLAKYKGIWEESEIEKTATNVSLGALKYGMLRVDNNTQINFNLDEWLRLDGETGPYLQYVHARCKNILEKLNHTEQDSLLGNNSLNVKLGESSVGLIKNSVETISANFVFETQVEQELIFLLSRFNDFALQAAGQYKPAIIAGYLYDLAKMFNRFYESCPIKSVEGNLRSTRLTLVEILALTMETGLGLLGIPAPNRM